MIELDEQVKSQIFDTLVEYAGAPESLWLQFMHQWPQCVEFRFQGSFGFGGKVWSNGGTVYVNCYREDETSEMLETMALVNTKLRQLINGEQKR
jgi:hypothetical protein